MATRAGPGGGTPDLCIDFGGTGIKAMVVSSDGKPVGDRALKRLAPPRRPPRGNRHFVTWARELDDAMNCTGQ